MKWVYELVARSQEARSSDCFVNSDSFKLRFTLKRNVPPLSGSYVFPLYIFISRGGLGGLPTLCSLLRPFDNVKRNDRITRSLSEGFRSSRWAGWRRYLHHHQQPMVARYANEVRTLRVWLWAVSSETPQCTGGEGSHFHPALPSMEGRTLQCLAV